MADDLVEDPKTPSELRRIEIDLELRRAELDAKHTQWKDEIAEKREQRLSQEKLDAATLELKRDEKLAAGHGLKFTTSQATVAAAVLALLSGAVGGGLQAWVTRDVEASKSHALIEIEDRKAKATVDLEREKQSSAERLDRAKFETSLITKATKSPDRQEQIRNLKFYLRAGFLSDPEGKIGAMDEDDYPSSPPPTISRLPAVAPAVSKLLQIFGQPANKIGPDCTEIDNVVLKSQIITETVGTLKITMLKPAIESLKEILSEIQRKEPELLKRVANLGTVCVKLLRGSTDRLSAHSFGTAIDLSFNGIEYALAGQGDVEGLERMKTAAEFFERAGWIWGGRWKPIPDILHFEVGVDLLEKWNASGAMKHKQANEAKKP